MTRILLTHIATTGVVVVAIAMLAVGLAFGPEHLVGLAIGAVLAILDGAGIVVLAGRALEPGRSGQSKAMFLFLLFGKLAAVAALLWWVVSRLGVSNLGVVIGLGAGLASVVAGAQRGSTSREGQAAIAKAEAQIVEEMRDRGPDSR